MCISSNRRLPPGRCGALATSNKKRPFGPTYVIKRVRVLAARTTACGLNSSARDTAAASQARSSAPPGLYCSLAKPQVVLAESCGFASATRLAACTAHATSSALPGWCPMAADPCTMLATARADTSPALRAEAPRACHATCRAARQ